MIRKAETQNDVKIKSRDTRFDSTPNTDLFEEFSKTLEEIAKKVSRRANGSNQSFYMETAPALSERPVEQLVARKEYKAESKNSDENKIEQPKESMHKVAEDPKKELEAKEKGHEKKEEQSDEAIANEQSETVEEKIIAKAEEVVADELKVNPEKIDLADPTTEEIVTQEEASTEVVTDDKLEVASEKSLAAPEIVAATKAEVVSVAANTATNKVATPQNDQVKIQSENIVDAIAALDERRDTNDLLKSGAGTKPLFSSLSNIKESLELKSLQLDAVMLSRVQQELTKQVDLRANASAFKPQAQDSTVKIDTTSVRNQNNIRLENQKEKIQRQSLTRVQQQAAIDKVEGVLKEAAKSKDGKSVSFRLDPPELGKVKVDLSLREGGLHARIVAESPQINNLLREKAQDLQQVLRKLGLNLEYVRVSVGSFDTAGTNNQPQQQPRQMKPDNTENFNVSLNGQGEAIQTDGLPEKAVDLDHWVA